MDYIPTRVQSRVLAWLQAEGYKIQKTKLSQDCKRGLLKLSPKKKVYTEREVRLYAAQLPLDATGRTEAEEEQTDSRENVDAKRKADIRFKNAQAARAEHNLQVQLGKYILKADIDLALAARATILDRGLDHLIRTKMSELIETVSGDQSRLPEAIAFFRKAKDEHINQYASKIDLLVNFGA